MYVVYVLLVDLVIYGLLLSPSHVLSFYVGCLFLFALGISLISYHVYFNCGLEFRPFIAVFR